MKSGAVGRRAKMTCLSCGAVSTGTNPYCDEKCEEYARTYGRRAWYQPKRKRGIPVYPTGNVRKADRNGAR